MKLLNKKPIFFYLICVVVSLSSCAQVPPHGEEINVIVSPHKLNVHSGSEDTLFVKVLDKQGGSLFGMKVGATSTSPTVATVTQEALTDVAGNATFTVKGISPGVTNIVISAMGYKATVEVVFIEH